MDEAEAVIQNAVFLRDAEVQAQFNDYYYDYTAPSLKTDLEALAEPAKKTAPEEKQQPPQDGAPVSLQDLNIVA